MSKIIKLTPEHISECVKEFQDQIQSGKFADGRVSFSKTISVNARRAKLYFSELAWLKMQTLIQEFDNEVAWHGVAKRDEDSTKDAYYVTDILVYPQKVTGATVDMDVGEYDEWIRKNFDDERFCNIAMQGHSHVRMHTTPSGVDLQHQEEILSMLTEDMFYIFVIWNKQGSKNVKIYDLAKNILFENADVDVEVIDDFLKDAKAMVKERPQANYVTYNLKNTPNTTYQNSTVNSNATQSKGSDKVDSEKKKDSGKRKGKRKKSSKYNNACDMTQFDYYDDLDGYPYNDPFYSRGY